MKKNPEKNHSWFTLEDERNIAEATVTCELVLPLLHMIQKSMVLWYSSSVFANGRRIASPTESTIHYRDKMAPTF